MAWHAVPVAILAGVSLYVAVLFIGLHGALAHATAAAARREYLTFALCCLSVSAYDASCVALYDAGSLAEGSSAQRWQFFTAAGVGVTYILFTWDYLKTRLPRFVHAGRALLVLFGLASILWDGPYTLTVARPAIKHINVFRYQFVYYECEAGVIEQLLMLDFFAMYAVAVVHLYRDFQSRLGRQRHGRIATLLAMLLSAMCAANDVMVASGVYESMYTFEYGIAAILMAMGYVLLMRFGELHEALDRLNRELMQSNAELVVALDGAKASVRAKTEFLASISHELRTPLNAIINLPEGMIDQFTTTPQAVCGACGALFDLEPGEVLGHDARCDGCGECCLALSQKLTFAGDGETAQGCLRTVVRSGRHLLGLVNDVLAASKLELGRAPLQPDTVDVCELAREIIDSAQIVADKKRVRLRLQVRIDDAVARIVADRIKLGQVLYNLVGNAIKFSPDGGVVEVGVRKSLEAQYLVSVRDHGIGIEQEYHDMIFEKFHQVDGGATRAYGGSGLGLFIAKGLVELHGGRIWVESSKGHGATFFVELPSVPANDTAPALLKPLGGAS